MLRLSTTTLPIVIFCFFTAADGALQRASKFSRLLNKEFPPGLPVIPGTNKIDAGTSVLGMYDPDVLNYHCDKIQKQRLALLHPNKHTTAIWKLEHAPRDVCKKMDVVNWHRRFSPEDGTTLLVDLNPKATYKHINGTEYRKEMVICPAMQYAYVQPSSPTMLQYSIMNACYYAPSDVTIDRSDPQNPAHVVNIFEQDPDDKFSVYYLGMEDQILLTPILKKL